MLKSEYGCLGLLVGIAVSVGAMSWATPVSARVGTIDNVPAATLLLPYFESDLNDANGSQTTVHLANSSATSILAHVTLWTDLAVPVMNFNIYFTGYDSVDIDVRLLMQGILPRTASAGQDPSDLISPKGPLSQDINYASCTGNASGQLPPNGLLDAPTVAGIRAALTGQSSILLSGQCGAVDHGDNIARGYITIDTVNNCTSRYPNDPNYFTQDITFQPSLFGSYTRFNRSENTQSTENMVSSEADGFGSVDPQVSTPGRPTFYASFNGSNASDHREALGTVWQARYFSGVGVAVTTKMVVWRDPGVTVSPFACGALPSPFPLTQREIVAFDEQEHATILNVGNTLPFALPYATQEVDTATLSPYQSGFLAMNLSKADDTRLQSYVSVRQIVPGAAADGAPAHQMITQSQLACEDANNATPGSCTQTFPIMFGRTIQ
ncbi:MAG: hypothetical protein ABI451_02130 [Dokdonella sp.]